MKKNRKPRRKEDKEVMDCIIADEPNYDMNPEFLEKVILDEPLPKSF